MTEKDLIQIAGEYGTPSFLFDTVALKARMRAIKEIVGEKVHLCYTLRRTRF